jgi:hypothetical protein
MVGMKKNTIYRFFSMFVLISLLVGATLAVRAAGQSAPASASILTLNPVADAYVVQTSPSTNYGTNKSLRLDASPVTHSYLRFVVSGLNGAAIQSALLRIYANSANTTGFSVCSFWSPSWLGRT